MKELSRKSAPDLPSVTVTFLFTDIEGSTQLLHRMGEDYVVLLADHHRLLREVFARRHGTEFLEMMKGSFRKALVDYG